ncbi:MAG: MBOAT family protein [Lachnospiraceae bacterium]|nr:MBOAT family protein [Lachnospiraceae bacterium]
MSFVSFSFALFVAAAVLFYYLIPVRYRYLVLLIFSLLFYYLACGKYIIYILLASLVTYISSMLMEKEKQKVQVLFPAEETAADRNKKKEAKEWLKKRLKRIMIIDLLLVFGTLSVLKYSEFVFANINLFRLLFFGDRKLRGLGDLVLPLGISFYTFQAAGYIIDLYYKRIDAEKNPFKLMLFVTFFPQIIQGPISRFKDLSPTLFAGNRFERENIRKGLYYILFGVAKKLIIADRLSLFVQRSSAFYKDVNGTYLLLTILFYSLQLYADFSGGINITIGTARLFGVEVTENFARPFFSKSVAEYWRRWHITLGTWFRDYIFYPISISKNLMNLGKKVSRVSSFFGKRTSLYTATIVVWALTGLWHGAEWRYVVWGLLNGIIMCVSAELEPLYAWLNRKAGWKDDSFLHKAFSIIRTFLIMSFLRIFDLSFEGIRMALSILKRILLRQGGITMSRLEELGLSQNDLIISLAGIALLFVISMLQRKKSIYERLMGLSLPCRWVICTLSVALILVFGYYGLGYSGADFIYMQF